MQPTNTPPQQHWQTLDQVLDDLQSRFIINIPDEELESIERICFQIEQAHWFYEDFVRESNPYLPSFSLKKFSALFFHHCPLLSDWAHDHEKAFGTFMQYKVRVPVCGAIVLNETMDKVVLVKSYKSSSSWSFPRGKINKEERKQDCAIREVFEETGFDMSNYLKESDFIERTIREQQICMYIVKRVPETTRFKTQTRKEISDIQWFPLEELPGGSRAAHVNKNKFYMVTVFLGGLKKWIAKQKTSNKKTQREFLTKKRTLESDVEAGYSDSGAKSDAEYRFLKGDVSKESVDAIQRASESLKSLLGVPIHSHVPQSSDASSDALKSLLGVQQRQPEPAVVPTATLLQHQHKNNLLGILMKQDTSPLIPARPLPSIQPAPSHPSDVHALKSILGIHSSPIPPPSSVQPLNGYPMQQPAPLPVSHSVPAPFTPAVHKSDLLGILMQKPSPAQPSPSSVPIPMGLLNSNPLPSALSSPHSNNNTVKGPSDTSSALKTLLGVGQPKMDLKPIDTIKTSATRRSSNKDSLSSPKTSTDVPPSQARKERKSKVTESEPSSMPFGKITILKRAVPSVEDETDTSSPLLSFSFDVDKIMDCF